MPPLIVQNDPPPEKVKKVAHKILLREDSNPRPRALKTLTLLATAPQPTVFHKSSLTL